MSIEEFTKATPFETDTVREHVRTYDPKDVKVTIGVPCDAAGNALQIADGPFTTLTPYTTDSAGVLVLRHDAAINIHGKQIADAMKQWRYPLYCVDRGDRVDPESQYLGPYKTHDEALGYTDDEDSGDVVRRCRQLRPSEIAFDRDAATLAEYEVFSALIDELDEAARSGNLPEGAWQRFDERTVHEQFDDDTFPTAQNYDTWIDDHASVDAFICEGDE